MTKREKRIARIRARPVEADVEDVQWILEEFGWIRRGEEGSSHLVFEKDGEYPMSIPVKGGQRVKRRYIEMVCNRLNLDD